MHARSTSISGACDKNSTCAVTASKLWSESDIDLSAAALLLRQSARMVSSRILSFLLFAATAALLLSAFLLAGPISSICFAGFFLLLGFSIGILAQQRMIHRLADAGEPGFGNELLNSTINEMREGLV